MTLDLNSLILYRGAHKPDEGKSCLMEAVSQYLNRAFSDRPEGVSPVLGSCGRILSDRMPDDQRAKLVQLIPKIAACDASRDEARMYLAADWAVRVAAPMALDARRMTERAATLRALPQLVDRETCVSGRDAAYAAYDAYAYAYAAYDAYDAAAYAAYAAAAAAAYAAYAADAYAAYAASYAADAAVAAVAAVAADAAVWDSAIDLFIRMIEA